jgi:hypothetical protein
MFIKISKIYKVDDTLLEWPYPMNILLVPRNSAE